MAFCTKCGKQLRDGEFCNCSINKNNFNQDFSYDSGNQSDFKEKSNNFSEEQNIGNNQETINIDIDETMSSLKSSWIAFKNRVGLGEPEVNERDCYESGMKIVPESIDANDGEMPVRQYDLAILRTRLKFMRAEGRMQVTNKRLVFRATGRSIMGRTTLQEEFAIDEVSGVEIRNDHRLNILNLLGCILILLLVFFAKFNVGNGSNDYPGVCFVLALVLAIPFFVLYKKFVLKLVTLTISAKLFLYVSTVISNKFLAVVCFIIFIIILACLIRTLFAIIFTPNLVVVIKTSGAAGAVEIKRKQFGKNKPEYTGYFEVLPWRDTEKAIAELGAMIDDIQNLGDAGVNKWKED